MTPDATTLAEEGFEAVTMRAIADRIEYTPTALYHHFPSKQALLNELCQSDFAGLASHMQGAAVPDPIERLRAVGEDRPITERELDVDVAMECTGIFTLKDKA